MKKKTKISQLQEQILQQEEPSIELINEYLLEKFPEMEEEFQHHPLETLQKKSEKKIAKTATKTVTKKTAKNTAKKKTAKKKAAKNTAKKKAQKTAKEFEEKTEDEKKEMYRQILLSTIKAALEQNSDYMDDEKEGILKWVNKQTLEELIEMGTVQKSVSNLQFGFHFLNFLGTKFCQI